MTEGQTEKHVSKITFPLHSPRHASASLLSLLSSEYFVLLLTVSYFVAVYPFAPPAFTSSQNLQDLFARTLPMIAVAIGQTIVLVTAGIDLSIISIVCLVSLVGARVMNTDTGLLAGSALAVPAGLLAMLAIGSLLGLTNGAAISYLRIPPFIVTMTTGMFFGGLAVWSTQSQGIGHLPATFTALGYGGIGPVPYALLLTGGLAFGVHLVLSRTVWGKWIYAVGHNSRTATVSGVPVRRVLLLTYMASGMCAAVGAIIYSARLETGSPRLVDQQMLLDVIGAVVIGGTSLFGGKGRIHWTVLGVLFITMIDNSLNMLGLSYFSIMMAKGTVILLAALIDALRHRLLGANS